MCASCALRLCASILYEARVNVYLRAHERTCVCIRKSRARVVFSAVCLRACYVLYMCVGVFVCVACVEAIRVAKHSV